MVRHSFLIPFIVLCLTFPSFALCIKKSGVNLRKGPGKNHKMIDEAFKYTPLKQVGKKGEWVHVQDFEKKTYWVHQNLVTKNFDCAVVKVEEANIRTGPGTNHEEIELSPTIKHETFKVIERKGSWVKVEDEFGGKGWIFRKLLWIY
ncbi:MAG: SH3 domain-containing protein [Nitrospirota bacterium]|nr:MAG: SH3 domain-containing protein [Nitrospirota bacterium]